MNAHIKIAKASFDDLGDILEIQKKAFVSEAEIYNRYDIEPLNQTLESINSDFYHYLFLKAEFNSRIVGSVKGTIKDGCCHIGKLIVSPEYQNRGIGKRLLAAIESEFIEANEYLLSTGHKSTKNIKFYESAGYKVINIFEHDKNAGFKLVEMVKNNNT